MVASARGLRQAGEPRPGRCPTVAGWGTQGSGRAPARSTQRCRRGAGVVPQVRVLLLPPLQMAPLFAAFGLNRVALFARRDARTGPPKPFLKVSAPGKR